MDVKNEKQYIFNRKLATYLGLYQILNTNTFNICGFNVYHIVISFFIPYMILISILLLIGLHHFRNDITVFVLYLGCLSNFLFVCHKMIVIQYNSKDLWRCIDVTSFKFLSYPHYNRDVFTNWRKFSIRTSYTYVLVVSFVSFFWVVSPVVFDTAITSMKNVDGSYSKYRMNVFNVYLMVSAETYNDNFYIFYPIEIVAGFWYGYSTIIFDVLTIMMCLAFSCQLESISDAIQSLGYNRPKDHLRTDNKYIQGKKLDVYNDLKMILTDHQNVLMKLDDYYNIFRSVTLIQIFVTSSSHVFIWFIASLSFDKNTNSDSILTIKLFIVLPLYSFQLYMTCALFGTINEKKNAINFALYSSNWTVMDLKSQKLILIAIQLNNAHNLRLKFTGTKTVNMEMFANTMRVCYSTFSMLLNYNNKK